MSSVVGWPDPRGLLLGLLSVFVGQVVVVSYHYARLHLCDGVRSVQKRPRSYRFRDGVASHLGAPGGVALLVAYLSSTWMLGLLPPSYYEFDGAVRWTRVAAQIATQDALMYVAHRIEHATSHRGAVGREFYRRSHRPHHRFTNPRLFDAFDGSATDTATMVLLPLFATAHTVRDVSVWEYAAFGTIWSMWLCLIHSETVHPWEPLFRALGLGTAADHHVHHRTFVYNYGHTIMWWDRLLGTYRSPDDVSGTADERVEAIKSA